MRIAIHPAEPSKALAEALTTARLTPVGVADVLALSEEEHDDGWDLVIVELGDSPTARLAFVRRVKEADLARVLVVAAATDHAELVDAPCDDFVLTPVSPVELAVRALRLVEPSNSESEESLHFKDLTLDLATYQARVGSSPIDLTYMEYELLRFFVTNQGRVWSREQLLSRVWGYDYFGGARTVDVHVRRLRSKLGEERVSWITTVRSVGYRFG
jgi:two-component system, OmpR family, alkaline phosphatase synthesis response regulator PhoP